MYIAAAGLACLPPATAARTRLTRPRIIMKAQVKLFAGTSPPQVLSGREPLRFVRTG
jgi:hypothetical protein